VRILQVIPYFYPAWSYGGTPRVAYELSRHLVKMGQDVWVFATDVLDQKRRIQGEAGKGKKIEKEIEGIKVAYFPNVSNWLAVKHKFFYSPGLGKYLKSLEQTFDIVHMHEYRTMLNISLTSFVKQRNIPFVLSAHGSLPPFMRKNLTKKAFDILFGKKILTSANRLLALSEGEKKQYQSMGASPNKVEILHNGIDLKAFENLPPSGSFKRKYRLIDKKIILFLGRLNRIKGLDFLLKSFALLSQKQKDAHLVIAGADDGYGVELKRLVKKLTLKEKVFLLSLLEETEKLTALRDAELLVYPSQYEIFGLVPFEALMCGTPVILSSVCGCAEILGKAGAAITISYGDIQEFVKRMEELLENKQLGDTMIQKGQKIIHQKLSWDYIAERTLHVYKDILNEIS